MNKSPSSSFELECKVRGLLMVDSFSRRNQHVLIFFTFFMLAELRDSFIPWVNPLEVAVGGLYLLVTHIGRGNQLDTNERFSVSGS